MLKKNLREFIFLQIKQAKLVQKEIIEKNLNHPVYNCWKDNNKIKDKFLGFCFMCVEYDRERIKIEILKTILDFFIEI